MVKNDIALFQFLKRNAFRREMAAVIVLKIVAIFILWGLFFSDANKAQLEKTSLIKHFVG